MDHLTVLDGLEPKGKRHAMIRHITVNSKHRYAATDTELHEIAKSDIDSFMKNHDFLGINVTIPYKETVIPYLDNISPQALSIGAVNTIINKNGVLTGYNTDYYGMKALFERIKVNPKNKPLIVSINASTKITEKNLLISINIFSLKISVFLE